MQRILFLFQLCLVLRRFECEQLMCQPMQTDCNYLGPAQGAVIYRFDKSSGGVFDFGTTTSSSDEQDEILFRMKFNTVQYNGVILGSFGSTYVINGTSNGNEILIQILNGNLVVALTVGSQRPLHWVGSGANDAEWHSFHIRQPVGMGVQFWYDNNLVYEQPAEDVTYRPNSPGPFYIGHFPLYSGWKMAQERFVGCLADVVYDGYDLLKNSVLTNVRVSDVCVSSVRPSFTLQTGDSWVKKQIFLAPVALILQLEFRLFSAGSIVKMNNINGVNIALCVADGKLLLTVNEIPEPVVLSEFSEELIYTGDICTYIQLDVDRQNYVFSATESYGNWMSLNLGMRENRLSLVVMGLGHSSLQFDVERKFGSPNSRDKMADLRLGGDGFIGCVRRWVLDGKLQNLSASDISTRGSVDLTSCSLKNVCQPNPCYNEGNCVFHSDRSSYSCECPYGYWGRYCQLSLLPASCDELYGYYQKEEEIINTESVRIDIDGSGELKPFVTNCLQTEDGHIWTVIPHILNEDLVINRHRFISRHRHEVEYSITKESLNSLIDDMSSSCTQSVVFRCFNGSLIGNSGNGGPYALWEGRSGSSYSSWGSAEPEAAVCDCSKNGTCLKQLKCNCDSGENTSDGGEISAKEHLPIVAVDMAAFDDFDQSAIVAIGPLKCHSGLNDSAVLFATRNSAVNIAVRRKSIGDGRMIEVKLEFRTSVAEGVLWFSAFKSGWVKLLFENDRQFSADFGYEGRLYSVDFISLHPLNDNKWHRVVFSRASDEIALMIDSFEPVSLAVPPGPSILDGTAVVGGSDQHSEGYRGFIRNVLVNGVPVKLKGKLSRDDSLGRICNSHPCLNGGFCVEHYDHFTCDCSSSEFEGSLCEKEVGVSLTSGNFFIMSVSLESHFSLSPVVRLGFVVEKLPGFNGLTLLDLVFDAENLSYVKLVIQSEGQLQLIRNSSDRYQEVSLLDASRDYADAQFYDLNLAVNGRSELSVMIDEQKVETSETLKVVDWVNVKKVTIGGDSLMKSSGDSHVLCASRMRVGDERPLKAFRRSEFPRNLVVVGMVLRSDCFSAPVAVATAEATRSNTCRMTDSVDSDQEIMLDPKISVRPLIEQKNTAWLGAGAGAILLLLFVIGCCLGRWIYRYPGGTYKTHENEFLTSDSTDTALSSVPLRTREFFM